jgi:hypothetical protein
MKKKKKKRKERRNDKEKTKRERHDYLNKTFQPCIFRKLRLRFNPDDVQEKKEKNKTKLIANSWMVKI